MVAHTELSAQVPSQNIIPGEDISKCSPEEREPNNTSFSLPENEKSLVSEDNKSKNYSSHKEEECSLIVAFFTFVSYGVLLLIGYIKEFFSPPSTKEKNREELA
ncbi:hypothetical protein SK128_008176 [Halocaridina rubra]|uniref:Uncharacterized protein n=1 Tax=Halocaridina rubra TaxID=373956 RepID=A0AAN9A3D1_HALRR